MDSNDNRLCEDENTPDTSRDTFPLKSTANVNENPVPAIPPDLAAIASAWPSIPEQIKAAVKAVLAPYLITEGGE